jgi:hypothetical protein
MRLALLALAALPLSCGGPTVGEIVSLELSLTARAVSSDSSAVAIGEPDGGVGLSRAYLGVKQMRFEPCNEEITPIDLEPRGYELIATPPYGERIKTAVQSYCAIELELAPLEKGGASVQVEGTDADAQPFELSTDEAFSLRLEAEDADGFGPGPFLLGVDAATWLAGLPLSEDMADQAASLLREQLQASVTLYVDVNDDGVLDPDEEPVHTTR